MPDVLTARGREHLEYLQDAEQNRRPIDPMLPVWQARDVIYCAATNLECQPPQPYGPEAVQRLRDVADFLVELDAAGQDLAILRNVLRFSYAPLLRHHAASAEKLAAALRSVVERLEDKAQPAAEGAGRG